ncbi:MAG: hypothetical protein ACI3XA_01875 [Clostridia bacterium]
MNRDSLTGQMDKSFAIKEFERLKKQTGYGAVLVKLSGGDNLPLYEAEDKIERFSRLIVNITNYEISRVQYGEFIIFCKDYKTEADKIFDILREFSDDFPCGVGAKGFDENEKDFSAFYSRLSGCATLSEIARVKKAVY